MKSQEQTFLLFEAILNISCFVFVNLTDGHLFFLNSCNRIDIFDIRSLTRFNASLNWKVLPSYTISQLYLSHLWFLLATESVLILHSYSLLKQLIVGKFYARLLHWSTFLAGNCASLLKPMVYVQKVISVTIFQRLIFPKYPSRCIGYLF